MKSDIDLIARRIIMASLLYYRHDHSFMTDGEFDKLCQRVANEWNDLSPLRQFQLGSPEEIRASGFHVKITVLTEHACYHWMEQQGLKPGHAGCINEWNFDEKHNLHWAGINS